MIDPHGLGGRGLRAPDTEHDACGVGFVANVAGQPSHELVLQGIEILERLEHRGACGCDPLSGDGAGLLMQVPHDLLRERAAECNISLPAPGNYGVGMVFLPRQTQARNQCQAILESACTQAGLTVLGWRDVPIVEGSCGELSLSTRPHIAQVFVAPRADVAEGLDEDGLERLLYLARKIAERKSCEIGGAVADSFYVCSLSCRTIIYKGMLMSTQLSGFFPDLVDPLATSALALVHSRFSTNTMPSWSLAQPFRYLAHNGEINTVRGNTNWMNAREQLFASPLFGDEINQLLPIIQPGQSDSAVFDNALELLFQSGRTLPHSVSMMIPEAWEKHESMSEEKKAFYRFHSCLLEPWDGPASIAFTDGRRIGAVLDRNGLRPSRYSVTKDGLVIMASETGVLDIDPADVRMKERLQPGRMFFVDLQDQRIIDDEEVKHSVAGRQPYALWLKENIVELDDLPSPSGVERPLEGEALARSHKQFGYTREDMHTLLVPMAVNGQEPIGSMGTDTPLACLSDRPQLVFNYFKQLFAQVTNPPVDPIREEIDHVSRTTAVGRQSCSFEESPEHCTTTGAVPNPY